MPERDDRTVFQPGAPNARKDEVAGPAGAEPAWFGTLGAPSPPDATDPPLRSPSDGPFNPPPPTALTAGPITIGVVLNHIYRVDRFIARGGMGEVYEGTNVNTDERVAIKIILPYLAADPTVQALFRNEARTLVRLSHPALVQYRVLAMEPELNVLYFVTEFIDGPSLGDVLGRMDTTSAQMVSLMRRLAAGLAVAHEAGMIHRDISPDNILLPGGQLDRAKIIDFGIAKDLDAAARGATRTIIGSGFAGKLGFVAPEQFGDTKEVGPWTDVYSLGLVILSLAQRKPVDMGASFAEAIERRRSVPDLSALPEQLQPVIGRMLQPDRSLRPQSMGDLLAALDAAERSATVAQVRSRTVETTKPPTAAVPRRQSGVTGWIVGVLGGAILVAAVVVAVHSFWPTPPPQGPLQPQSPTSPPAPSPPYAPPADPLALASEAAQRAIAGINCSWLDSTYPEHQGKLIHVAISGVARDPNGASNQISSEIQKAGLSPDVDTTAVGTLSPAACPLMNKLMSIRDPGSPGGNALSVAAKVFHVEEHPTDCPRLGLANPLAQVVYKMAIENAETNFSLLFMQADGTIGPIWRNRQIIDEEGPRAHPPVEKSGNTYSHTLCTYLDNGAANNYQGLLLLTGRGELDLGLDRQKKAAVQGAHMTTVPTDVLESFTQMAHENGWKAQMAWFRIDGAQE